MLDEQVGLLTLLKEFDSICRKHNITYFLEGGSLLGAVRHKGFLPWDDDVDLCITRAEFEKLLAVIDQDLPANRELYCYERYPEYLRETVKYTNLDSTVLFPNHILDGLAAGQHIDLFILDPAPSDPKELEEYKMLATVYSELLTPVYVLCSGVHEYLDEYNKYLKMMDDKGRDYVLNMLRKKLYAYEDDENCTTYYLRWGCNHRFFDKSIFGKPVEVEFEGNLYPAPQYYHRFLRAEFGDTWMMLPAVAHREVHGTYDCYNTPCKEFIADYSPFINYEEMRQAYATRKKYNLEKLKLSHALARERADMNRIIYEVALDTLLTTLTPEQERILTKERHYKFVEMMQPYIQAQFSDELTANKVPIHVSKEVLYATAYSLIMIGRYWEAERLISFHKGNFMVYTKAIDQLMELIVDIRACMLAVEEQRYDDAAQLADRWITDYPMQLNLAVFKLEQGLRDGVSPATLLSQTKKVMHHHPDSDQLMFLMGRLLTAMGRIKEGMEWYKKCASITYNGLLRMELPPKALAVAVK